MSDVTKVCAICDIAGCKHIREQDSAEQSEIETLKARVEELEWVLADAERVMAKNIYPKPDVRNDHPFAVLTRVRAALTKEGE